MRGNGWILEVSTARRIRVALPMLLRLFQFVGAPMGWSVMGELEAHCEDIVVSVDADEVSGILPNYFKSSAFQLPTTNTWPLQEYIADQEGALSGMVRGNVEVLGISESLEDLKARLQIATLNEIADRVAAAGGDLLLGIVKMPLWLTSRPELNQKLYDDWYEYQTHAPADLDEWKEAVTEIVKHFSVTRGLNNVRYEFWNEPDLDRFWNGSQEEFIQLYEATAEAVKAVDPTAQIGGCAPSRYDGMAPGGTIPLLQELLNCGAPIDFCSFHFFKGNPLDLKAEMQQVSQWMQNPVPVVISEHNVRELDFSHPSWPFPPSATGRQADSEMNASAVLTLMQVASESGLDGFQTQELYDAPKGQEYPAGTSAMRTCPDYNGIRRAVYNAHLLLGKLQSDLLQMQIAGVNSSDRFPHFYAFATSNGSSLAVLAWNYVPIPASGAAAVFSDEGYDTEDFDRWGGVARIYAYLEDTIAVEELTTDPDEQADLLEAQDQFHRLQQLAGETHSLSLSFPGLTSASGFTVKQFLIDEFHSNSYRQFVDHGVDAAIESQRLEVAYADQVTELSGLPAFEVKPFCAMLFVIEFGSPLPPSAPSELSATVQSMDSVRLDWQDLSSNETAFVVEGREAGGFFSELALAAAGATRRTVAGLQQATDYEFRVRARNVTAFSAYSDIVVARTFSELEQWRQDFFGSVENSGDGADSADSDMDGDANLLEYLAGTDPTDGSSRVEMVAGSVSENDERYLTLSLARNGQGQGVRILGEVSGDLFEWDSDPSATTVLEDSSESLTLRDNIPVSAANRRFLRIRVEALPN